jgi:hypothetical protein
MNWGLRIVLVYLGFIAMILTLVVKARSEKIELVTPDYYAQEIVYQQRIEALTNANALSDTLKVTATKEWVTVELPPECLGQIENGMLRFYRPSDASLDQSQAFTTESSVIVQNTRSNLPSGLYVVQCSWRTNNKAYYMEKPFQLP